MKEACQKSTVVSKVKVQGEHGRRAIFLNRDNEHFITTRFDGCVVENERAADWIVTKPGFGDLIVELKGKNVEHALKQLEATAEFLTDHNYRAGKIAGVVVARQCPTVTSSIQRAQLSFSRRFKGRIHVICGNREHSFELLFAP